MTKGEINLLYTEVEKLLSDICKFLKEEISNGYISPDGKSLANILIERSKQQLQAIAKVTVIDTSDCSNEPYVDMQGYKANQENEEPQEVYSDVSMTFEPPSNISLTEEECYACPYANLPAHETGDGKVGHLYRKEKILFFEQQKKVYAAVKNSWLLVYLNEHSLKPFQTFDLTRYEAKPSPASIKDVKKRDETFELTNIVDTKLHYFTALTHKDMMQWVATLNKQSENVTLKRSLPPVPPNDASDKLSQTSMEYGNDYEPLTEYQILEHARTNATQKNHVDKDDKRIESTPLPLPPRNTPQKNKPALIIPPSPSSEESLDDYDFVSAGVVKQSSQESRSSFSEDDSDTVYDNPAELLSKPPPPLNVKPKIETPMHLEDEQEDDIYDYLQSPSTITLPKPDYTINNKLTEDKKQDEDEIKGKSKPMVKPRLLSFKNRRKNNL